MQRFRAKLESAPRGGHYVVVPAKVSEAIGLRHGSRVRGQLAGVAYRSSLMKSAGALYLGVHKATIEAAGIEPGARVEIAIEPDDKPLPTDTVPADLRRAIDASKRARAAWATLAPSHRREHVRHVIEAKKPETRTRRIAATIAMLEAKPAAKAPPRRNAAPTRKRTSSARPRG